MGDFIATFGMEIIGGCIALIFGVLGLLTNHLVNKFLNTKEKRTLASDVVLYVEQKYKDLHGQEKFVKAVEAFTEILNQRGIKTTTTEIQTLIESALGAFNNAFKNQEVVK
jgi:hypothetical protein